jgi:malonyl-CoA O-methyltransferase
MKVAQEFSRYASEYESYNVIQNKVVKKLISLIKGRPKKILDLGCGSGAVYKEISWEIESFIGIDFATGMLESHPKAAYITCKHGDFNDRRVFEELAKEDIDYIISASALQWAEDLDSTFLELSRLNRPIALAIFTCKTFETLYKTADLKPLLRCSDEIMKSCDRYFDAKYELISYTLEFESINDIFRYIKRSGVSGGRKVLDYRQTKELMRNYPNRSLEFEVLFITS